MLPGRHCAATGGDLPEQLAVALVSDFRRRPVGGLGVERDRRGAVALALGAVEGDAVDLRHLLALLDDLIVAFGDGFLFAFSAVGATHGVCADADTAVSRSEISPATA